MTDQPMRVVFLSHTALSSVFRVGSHHLSRELAAAGHQVLHISNPMSLAAIAMMRDAEFRRRARLAVPIRLTEIEGAQYAVGWSLFPLDPDPLRRPVTLGSTRILANRLRAEGFGEPDLMFVDQPQLEYLIDPIAPKKIIYRPTDVWETELPQRAEARVVRRADGLIGTSSVVVDELVTRYGISPSAVVENGVDLRHFAEPADTPDWEQRAGAVYVGALDYRFDWQAVDAMARANPDVRIDVYGPVSSVPEGLAGNLNVKGPVAYEDLPSVLRTYRVGLLPLNDHPKNRGRSPMKLYEYLTSGLTVVARGLGSAEALSLADVSTYSDVDGGARALTAALATPPDGDGRRAADRMGWAARAQLLLETARQM